MVELTGGKLLSLYGRYDSMVKHNLDKIRQIEQRISLLAAPGIAKYGGIGGGHTTRNNKSVVESMAEKQEKLAGQLAELRGSAQHYRLMMQEIDIYIGLAMLNTGNMWYKHLLTESARCRKARKQIAKENSLTIYAINRYIRQARALLNDYVLQYGWKGLRNVKEFEQSLYTNDEGTLEGAPAEQAEN